MNTTVFQNTYRVFLAFCLLVLISGCASGSAKPLYRRYTMRIYPPKPADYSVPVLYERPSRKFEYIGRFSCFSVQSAQDDSNSPDIELPSCQNLMLQAQAKARNQGADAILVSENRLISSAYSREVRKCDPPTPNIPDNSNSKCKNDKKPGDGNNKKDRSCNSGSAPGSPTVYSETETGSEYTLAFDVDLIAYTEPEKTPPAPAETENSSR